MYHRGDLKEISDLLNLDNKAEKILNNIRGKEKAINNTLNAIALTPNEALVQKLSTLTAEKVVLEQEFAKCKLGNIQLTKRNISKACKALGKHLITSKDPETKAYLKSIIDEIKVGNDNVSVKLNIA